MCTGVRRAKGATESVVLHLLHPDEHSRKIAQHLMRSVCDFSPIRRWSYRTHCEAARAMLGDPLADALGLEKGSIWQRLYIRFVVIGSLSVLSALMSPWIVPGSKMSEGIKKVMRMRVASELKLRSPSKA